MARSYTPALNPSGEQDPWKLPQTVNKLLQGKSNNVGDVTFTASATTTLIKNGLIGPNSHIDLAPLTANARTALGAAYISARIEGQATVTHASNAAVDQTFTYEVTG
jgi:hypothetical protein